MSVLIKTATTVEYNSNLYPVEHWRQLRRFAVGRERDPRGLFQLTDDKWDVWPYALNGMPSRAPSFRLDFGRYKTFLKLYLKWYCYFNILGKAGRLTVGLRTLSGCLVHADRYISEQGFRSVDDLASTASFRFLWDAQIKTDQAGELPLSQNAVTIQSGTRIFWQRVRVAFGVPPIVPPVAPHTRVKPIDFAADRSKVIPGHVIRQLANKLALHREKKELLRRLDHLRLCVLMLAICLGRRINEILLSPRGSGNDGPLSRHPSNAGSPEGSLWFQFLPNKDGPSDKVFISPEWEDVALYCVHTLVKYGDEIRRHVPPEEWGLLILVSRLNSTYGRCTPARDYDEKITVIKNPVRGEAIGAAAYQAHALAYPTFYSWLTKGGKVKGLFKRWAITEDGLADGPAYRLAPSFTRHSRQNALALDPHVSTPALQRDLNHREPDTHLTYQHNLREINDSLLEKIQEGKLMGRGAEWLSELLGDKTGSAPTRSGFKPGCPGSLTPRMRTLIKSNPEFVQINRVPEGICASPYGPAGCSEFLKCTCAAERGCQFFAVDVDDAWMLQALNDKAAEGRRLQQESASAGKVVQAQKRDTQARRTEELRDEAIRRASAETLATLRRLQTEVEEKGL